MDSNFGLSPVVAGIARHILTAVGAALVSDGVVSSDQLHSIGGAVVVLASVVWSIYQKYEQKRLVVKAAVTGSVNPIQGASK